MFNPLTVIGFFCFYIGILFVIALWVERKSVEGRNIGNNPLVYSLSLAIYCTTWTFYGSVGKAATSGMLFLTIYLGPTLAIILWWIVLRKFIRIKNIHRITSIADFISARYNKSQRVAAIATVIALAGIVPYMALQLKAVISTFELITAHSNTDAISLIGQYVGPIIVGLMVLFTIAFGARRLDPTERHQGMVVAMAVESVVKLVAFLAAGIFITYFMFNGFSDIFHRLAESPVKKLLYADESATSFYLTWTTYLILAMSAILFLPRQFHIAVVENFDENHIRTAMWIFPLYMLLINIFVFPIAIGGLLQGFPVQTADTFVLSLPLYAGQKWLSLLVFIGGFSAATGMIMISTMTMSIMVTNHLLLPVLEWIKQLGFLRRYLLQCRWAVIAGYIVISYGFERYVGESFMLVNMGMISFAAVLQFAPVMLGGIFWKPGNKAGAVLGLSAGFLLWFYTLLIPAFMKSGWMSKSILESGLWGIELLKPEQLFGLTVLDPLSHAVFWSMFFNVGLYIIGSLAFFQSATEQRLAEEFVDVLTESPKYIPYSAGEDFIDFSLKKKEIETLLSQYFTDQKTSEILDYCIRLLNMEGKSTISILDLTNLHNEVEKYLAGSIGAAAAHLAMRQGTIFTEREEQELSNIFAEILANLKLTPEELQNKIDYYQEREGLLARQAVELKEKVKERDTEIAERRRAEESLAKHQEQLEGILRKRTSELEATHAELVKREKLSVLGRLTAVVSHELRNPLGVIRSSVFYLMSKLGGTNETIKKHLERIDGQVTVCDTIIADLLEYTRGHLTEKVKGDLNTCLQEVLDQIPLPGQVAVVRKFSPGLPFALFDKEKFRRVVINVFDNALYAVITMQERLKNGEIPYYPTITIATFVSDNGIAIEFEDNGIGMDEETARHSFEPLFTTRPRGTGLGLAIVQKIVNEHGGSISLYSKINKGTKIIMTLPLANDNPVL
jgi:Na+/proline symporter/signal transduction histidine kinase